MVDAGDQDQSVSISRAKMMGKEMEQLFLSFRKRSMYRMALCVKLHDLLQQ